MRFVTLVGKNTHRNTRLYEQARILTSCKFVTEESRYLGISSKLGASPALAPYGVKQTEAGYLVHPV